MTFRSNVHIPKNLEMIHQKQFTPREQQHMAFMASDENQLKTTESNQLFVPFSVQPNWGNQDHEPCVIHSLPLPPTDVVFHDCRIDFEQRLVTHRPLLTSRLQAMDVLLICVTIDKIPAWLHYISNDDDEKLLKCLRLYQTRDSETGSTFPQKLMECLKVYQGEVQLAKLMTWVVKITHLHESISELIGQYQ
jgi:hypothetical protein